MKLRLTKASNLDLLPQYTRGKEYEVNVEGHILTDTGYKRVAKSLLMNGDMEVVPEKTQQEVLREVRRKASIPAEDCAEQPSVFGTDSDVRKEYPVFSGLLEYFPRACAEIAHLSYLANYKHNGDTPMRWAKEKSSDHKDCELRHAMDHDYVAKAWRALADLQIELENGYDPEREYKQYRQTPVSEAKAADPVVDRAPTQDTEHKQGGGSQSTAPHTKGIHRGG
jgi:hypothetical protein